MLEAAQQKLLIYRSKLGPEYVGGIEYTILQARITDAIPLAKRQAEMAEALGWVLNEFKHDRETYEYLLSAKDCPPIIRELLGDKE